MEVDLRTTMILLHNQQDSLDYKPASYPLFSLWKQATESVSGCLVLGESNLVFPEVHLEM